MDGLGERVDFDRFLNPFWQMGKRALQLGRSGQMEGRAESGIYRADLGGWMRSWVL